MLALVLAPPGLIAELARPRCREILEPDCCECLVERWPDLASLSTLLMSSIMTRCPLTMLADLATSMGSVLAEAGDAADESISLIL